MEAELREEESASAGRYRRTDRRSVSPRTAKRTEPEEFPYWKNNKDAKELSELLMEYLT